MRTLVTLLICMICVTSSFSQITLDTTYPDGGLKLYMVDLEISGMKYIEKSDEPDNRYLKFYNLDHSVWKTIDCNDLPITSFVIGFDTTYTYNYSALYISETLFDCDDKLEFMYSSNTSNYEWFSGIYNEDGVPLLEADSCAPLVKVNIPQQYRPIYNTSEGTKMILSHQNGSALVYDLPCALSTRTDRSLDEGKSAIHIFPNPSDGQVTVNYELPMGKDSGQLVIYDMIGNLVKSYEVGGGFSNIIIDADDLSTGTYLYSLMIDGHKQSSKRVVISE